MVKVFPNSKKQEIIKKSENRFEVKVKQKPVMGKANQEAIKMLAYYFKIPKSEIKLIKGFKKTNKIFVIKDK